MRARGLFFLTLTGPFLASLAALFIGTIWSMALLMVFVSVYGVLLNDGTG